MGGRVNPQPQRSAPRQRMPSHRWWFYYTDATGAVQGPLRRLHGHGMSKVTFTETEVSPSFYGEVPKYSRLARCGQFSFCILFFL